MSQDYCGYPSTNCLLGGELDRLKSQNKELREALIIAMTRFSINKETEADFDKCVKALKESE